MAAFALIASLAIAGFLPAASAQTTVDLGTADPFAILAGSAVTNTGPSVINGDIGVHPGSSVTGFGPPAVVNGEIHVADAVAEQAKVDLTTAYNDAAGRPPNATLETELGGRVLFPGVYDSLSGTFGLTGTLTLDAQGDADAVWIFQMESTLTTATDSSAVLVNGAQACNVFWQVGSSATLGTRTDFKGTIMAHAAITMNDGATLDGRALARTEAVTMINNVITVAECAGAPPVDDQPPEEPPTDDQPPEEPPTDDQPPEEPPTDDQPPEEPPTDDQPPEESPTDDQPPVACSTGLTATANADRSITLTWNPVEGAEQYHLHRAVGEGAFVLHAEVEGDVTSVVDTDTQVDVTHRYEVKPVVGGVESQDCEVAEITAIPFFPGLLVGATAVAGSVAGYAVMRRRT